MAKDESQLNLTVVALVALVAIVGLVALVMNAAAVTKVATLKAAETPAIAGHAAAQASDSGAAPIQQSPLKEGY